MTTAAEKKKADEEAAARAKGDPGSQTGPQDQGGHGTTGDQANQAGHGTAGEQSGAAAPATALANHGATTTAQAPATRLAPGATALAGQGKGNDTGKSAEQLHAEQGAAGFQFAVPKGMKGQDGIDTLMDACERYGINPDPDIKPRELLSWKYYGEDMLANVPGYVVLVTGGGMKIRHWDDPDYPMDVDTEERLRGVFNAYRIDPATKLPVPVPLPDDHTLPLSVVDGIGRTQDHRYRGGYLKQGGKLEAARRQQERKARPKR